MNEDESVHGDESEKDICDDVGNLSQIVVYHTPQFSTKPVPPNRTEIQHFSWDLTRSVIKIDCR